jgi:hypothetical protein
LLRIAPGGGSATLVRSLVGLPSALSTPALDDKGQLLIFAGNAPLLGGGGTTRPAPGATLGSLPRLSSPPPAATPAASVDATFPSLLIFNRTGEMVANIDRDHILAYPDFPIFGTRLTQLAPHPRESAWLSYDANSGEFLMLRIRERIGP